MGLFTKAHWLKPISLISHTSFLGHVSFCYCRTSGDSKRKKTPKFWFCSSVGPELHVQPGPKANKRNRWHPSKGSHPASISHYTNLQALLHNKWLHSSIQCAFWIPMSSVEYPPLQRSNVPHLAQKRVIVHEAVETLCSESVPFVLDTATPP